MDRAELFEASSVEKRHGDITLDKQQSTMLPEKVFVTLCKREPPKLDSTYMHYGVQRKDEYQIKKDRELILLPSCPALARQPVAGKWHPLLLRSLGSDIIWYG